MGSDYFVNEHDELCFPIEESYKTKKNLFNVFCSMGDEKYFKGIYTGESYINVMRVIVIAADKGAKYLKVEWVTNLQEE